MGGSSRVGRRVSELLQEVGQMHVSLSGLKDRQGGCRTPQVPLGVMELVNPGVSLALFLGLQPQDFFDF